MATGLLLEPAPVKTPPVTGVPGLMDASWVNWLTLQIVNRVQQTAPLAGRASLVAQVASLGPAALVVSASGLYRVSFYVRVVTPASVSSAINVSILTTDGSVTVTLTPLPAATGNTTGTVLAWAGLVRADAGTPISFTTTYASVGTAMAYDVALVAEGPF